ncbi:putative LRR containing protein [Trachipleistophora hominis]|uniref:Putative LRR containing protein n=1 Tax=Trachipleistophora hominis TaxID=72359 RepID=L7JYJ3_TRAHO|nr:putative LRR containing protein [Trachipleistophora hominis]
MIPNLYCYIRTVLKYSLRFQTNENLTCDEYMIFDVLDDTGLVNFIDTCRTNTIIKNQSHSVQTLGINNDTNRTDDCDTYMSTYKNTYYVNQGFGTRVIKRRSYDDIIQSDKDVMYEVIDIPFSRQLFLKIMCLSIDYVPMLTIDDIHVILKYVLPFEDKTSLLVYAICEYLRKNKLLIKKWTNWLQGVDETNLDQTEKQIALFVLDKSGHSHSFREIVNSHVVFQIMDSNNESAKTLKHEEMGDLINCTICINDLFALGFLIKYISMNYTYFDNNMYVLDTIFDDDRVWLSLDVRIYNIDLTPSSIIYSAKEVLRKKLFKISECKFLLSKRIRCITLGFKNIRFLFDLNFLGNMNVPISLHFSFCSLDFISSTPKNVENVNVVFRNPPSGTPKRCQNEHTELLYENFVFSEKVYFSSFVKIVKIQNSKIEKNAAISFDEGCEHILITKTTGEIILFNAEECCTIMLLGSNFEYCKRNALSTKILSIDNVEIHGIIRVDGSVDNVSISNAKLSSKSRIDFCDNNKSLCISGTRGSFDLTLYIGLVLYLRENMWIKTIVQQSEVSNSIFLCNIHFKESPKLSNNYSLVELHQITAEKNSSITINEACTTLSISKSRVVIDMTRVKKLYKMRICFSADEVLEIKFIGLISVTILELRDIHKNIDLLKLLANYFSDIRHLRFDNEYNGGRYCTFRNSTINLPSNHSSTANFGTLMRRFSGYLPAEEHNTKLGVSNVVNNDTTLVFAQTSVIQMFSKLRSLEFIKCTTINDDCYYFATMKNLEILKVCIRRLRGDFFNYLPTSLKLLDISNSLAYSYKSGFIRGRLLESQKHQFYNLIVLVIHSSFLPYLHIVSTLMPSLRVLRIFYDSEFSVDSRVINNKLQLCELFIEGGSHLIDFTDKSIKNTQIDSFISLLSKYIYLQTLNYFAFISEDKLLEIDPLTYNIVDRKLYEKFDCHSWKKKYTDMECYWLNE